MLHVYRGPVIESEIHLVADLLGVSGDDFMVLSEAEQSKGLGARMGELLAKAKAKMGKVGTALAKGASGARGREMAAKERAQRIDIAREKIQHAFRKGAKEQGWGRYAKKGPTQDSWAKAIGKIHDAPSKRAIPSFSQSGPTAGKPQRSRKEVEKAVTDWRAKKNPQKGPPPGNPALAAAKRRKDFVDKMRAKQKASAPTAPRQNVGTEKDWAAQVPRGRNESYAPLYGPSVRGLAEFILGS